MVSRVLEHAEFDGALRSRFQTLLGVMNLLEIFEDAWGSKNKKAKIISNGGLRYAK